MQTKTIIASPLGNLEIIFTNNNISKINITSESKLIAQCNLTKPQLKIINNINKFFQSACDLNHLPFELNGTAFQLKVWLALQEITLGQTITYGKLAEKLNSSAQAVGNACRANPIPIVIPCHRVIAKHGLGGYAGHTNGRWLNIKKWLLGHEKSGKSSIISSTA